MGGRLSEEDAALMRRKMELVLQTAFRMGHANVVLGALGCGAYGCPPRDVARLFAEVLERYRGTYSRATFAILGSNFNFFSDVFGK